MFGYVQIRKPELKIKDYEQYQGFYCGLCDMLKEKYGFLGELTLTYDMTFLVILLSSVYEFPTKQKKERCIVHPAKKRWKLTNEATEYAAHLNLILSYYHFLDDKEDEGSKKAWLGSKLYFKSFRKAEKIFENQADGICRCMKNLSLLEQEGTADLNVLADCFGNLMKILFSYRNDVFSDYLKELGYFLGRFIYLMDAYDDLGDDIKKGCFNPLKKEYLELKKQHKPGFETAFEKKTEELLLDEISAAAAAYQKLPCIAYRDILGNILYAGVWNRFDQMRMEREERVKKSSSVINRAAMRENMKNAGGKEK